MFIFILFFNRFSRTQALTQDGENPDEYVFESGSASPKKQPSISLQGNGTAEDGEDENVVNESTDTSEKADSAEVTNENVVENQASEPSEQEQEQEQDQDQIQLTMAESDKLDNNTLDNEDSLNLTIGEDEAKIFQDEVNASRITRM